jgi:hypothetical protein
VHPVDRDVEVIVFGIIVDYNISNTMNYHNIIYSNVYNTRKYTRKKSGLEKIL